MEIRTIRGTASADFSPGSYTFESDGGHAAFRDGDHDLFRLATLIRKRLRLVIFITALGTALAAFAGLYVIPNYTAKALLVIGPDPSAAPGPSDDAVIDTQIAEISSEANLQSAFLQLSKDPAIHAAVPTLVDLERHLKVMQELRSKLIDVAFTSRSPQVAAEVANRLSKLYIDRLQSTSDRESDETAGNLTLESQRLRSEIARLRDQRSAPGRAAEVAADEDRQLADLKRRLDSTELYRSMLQSQRDAQRQRQVLSPPVRLYSLALTPAQPSSPKPILIIFPGFVLSLMAGCAAAILLGRFSRTIQDEYDLREAVGAGSVCSLPYARKLKKLRPFEYLSKEPGSAYSEAIRSLVITLAHGDKSVRTVLFTSSVSDEGKTTLASSFASYAACVGRRVVLVDMDFTRQDGIPGARSDGPGLFTVLSGQRPLRDAIQKQDRGNIDVIAMGPVPSDPLPLVCNEVMAHLLDELKQNYDLVVINGTPVLDISEIRILAPQVDRIVLAIRAMRTKKAHASEAVQTLTEARAAPNRAAAMKALATVITFTNAKSSPRRNRRIVASNPREPSARAIVTLAPVEPKAGSALDVSAINRRSFS